MSFSHITKYDTHTFMGYTHHTPALPIMHFISLFKNSINLIKLCLLNLNFDGTKVKQSIYLLECCKCIHVILVLYKI